MGKGRLRLLLFSCMCSEDKYRSLFSDSGRKPGQQVQKYHRVLYKGLSGREDVEICAISKLPVQRDNSRKLWIGAEEEAWCGSTVHYLPACNLPVLSHLTQLLGGFCSVLRHGAGRTVAVINVLDIAMDLGVVLACRARGIPVIGIVTDLPQMLFPKEKKALIQSCERVIGACDGFVLLTEAMNQIVNPDRRKPWVVIEGWVDSDMKDRSNDLARKASPRTCLYTGSVHRVYGIEYLVRGFLQADIPDAELHIYGDGDYAEELRNLSRQHPSVKYFGERLIDEVISAQIAATLLINPRPTDPEYVKYSFPSKNMEYMASGTPVLTTRLPGMPEEYYPYIYTIEEESAEGIASALRCILSLPARELWDKGASAKAFVLREKSGEAQAGRMVELARKLRRRPGSEGAA